MASSAAPEETLPSYEMLYGLSLEPPTYGETQADGNTDERRAEAGERQRKDFLAPLLQVRGEFSKMFKKKDDSKWSKSEWEKWNKYGIPAMQSKVDHIEKCVDGIDNAHTELYGSGGISKDKAVLYLEMIARIIWEVDHIRAAAGIPHWEVGGRHSSLDFLGNVERTNETAQENVSSYRDDPDLPHWFTELRRSVYDLGTADDSFLSYDDIVKLCEYLHQLRLTCKRIKESADEKIKILPSGAVDYYKGKSKKALAQTGCLVN
ncbi:hypothetical protein BJ508DRAFT_329393 [Ascobolus immersus RN42]|uniref:Uncharacterized protein n=1 Tax=Ascobolus immersus RN42 TaxID=1160509 RepID=A0A3N4HYT6_ASCIM|nr:hypothetical protein BJ508DRAFT_329393 [Ascobolus immersus RN42]